MNVTKDWFLTYSRKHKECLAINYIPWYFTAGRWIWGLDLLGIVTSPLDSWVLFETLSNNPEMREVWEKLNHSSDHWLPKSVGDQKVFRPTWTNREREKSPNSQRPNKWTSTSLRANIMGSMYLASMPCSPSPELNEPKQGFGGFAIHIPRRRITILLGLWSNPIHCEITQ